MRPPIERIGLELCDGSFFTPISTRAPLIRTASGPSGTATVRGATLTADRNDSRPRFSEATLRRRRASNQCREVLLDSVVGSQHNIFIIRDGILLSSAPRFTRLVASTSPPASIDPVRRSRMTHPSWWKNAAIFIELTVLEHRYCNRSTRPFGMCNGVAAGDTGWTC